MAVVPLAFYRSCTTIPYMCDDNQSRVDTTCTQEPGNNGEIVQMEYCMVVVMGKNGML